MERTKRRKNERILGKEIKKMIYLDTTFFVCAALDESNKGQSARELLKQIHNKEIKAMTSLLTFDELFWNIKKLKSHNDALTISENFLKIRNLEFIEITNEIIWNSLEVLKKYNADPRDAIHAASALSKGIQTIISEDKDFDKIKEIKRKQI